jgi:hypothetical protein
MQTYPLFDKDGRRFAFEIEHAFVGGRKIASLLRSVEGVSGVVAHRTRLSNDDVRVEFFYAGKPYVVWEPWGDSSRFWIGPKEESNDAADIQPLECVFRDYRPPVITKVLGGIGSLTFLTLKRKPR